MNKKEKSLEKIKIALLVTIMILLLLNLFQRGGMLESIQKATKKLLNNGEMTISEDGIVAQTLNSSSWDTSKVTATKDADGKDVPVPKGYVGSSVAGENKVNEGYVIYEGTTAVTSSNVAVARTSRNQWVWVPVPYPDRIYEEVNGVKKSKLYTFTESGRSSLENRNYEPAILPEYDNTTNLSNGGLTGMTPDKLYQELQLEFDETIESIEKYGGVYIGRYETGNLSQSKPVVMKMNTDISNQSWYKIYSKIGYLAAGSNVKTNIIWGCLWDETLQRMADRSSRHYIELVEASSAWGNYSNSTFSYNNTTKAVNQSVKIPTGSTEYTKTLNIYDLAGNIWEATMEGTGGFCRIYRGGCYNSTSNFSVGTRNSKCKPSDVTPYFGCRAYLYIK